MSEAKDAVWEKEEGLAIDALGPVKEYLPALTLLGFFFFFCLFNYFMGDLRQVNIIFSLGVLGFYSLHRFSRAFVILTFPLLLKDMIYDSLRYIPFAWLTPINIAGPYNLDKKLFGIQWGNETLLLHEFIMRHGAPLVSYVCAIFYHVLDPFAYFLVFLLWWFNSRRVAQRYAAAFFLMNLFAFATYVLYPAAAPWYVAKYGFVQPLAPILGDPAGLAQFDHAIGANLATKIYSENPVVFGAIPSMHAGFTMLGLLYSFYLKKKWRCIVGAYAVSVWYAALFLQHHYMIDVVIGIAYATVTFLLIEVGFKKIVGKTFDAFFHGLFQSKPRPIFNKFQFDSSRFQP